MRRICLVTPKHLTANPRLVKEADALAEAGYDVHVFACQWMDWETKADKTITRNAKWATTLLQWASKKHRYLFWKSRLRQHACRRWLEFYQSGPLDGGKENIALRAYDRVLPELRDMVMEFPADLYIAHNLQALPIAIAVAAEHGARVGFDAEDFHSGMRPFSNVPTITDAITEYIERRYLPQCDYITAASPGIADAYASKYSASIQKPIPILNVSPLSQRPPAFRHSQDSAPLTLYWFSQTIGAERGLEDVVRAMGALGEFEIELHLRGDWQPGYRDHLLGLAATWGVRESQIIAHHTEPSDEMIRLAAQYDVGLALEQRVSENRDICLTNKFFTYLLAGTAIVASDTKGQRPAMASIKGAGFCYEQGDTDALTAGLRLWAQNRKLLEATRCQAWEQGTRQYNWDIEKGTFLQIIDRVGSIPDVKPR